jgi:hypothetical protein
VEIGHGFISPEEDSIRRTPYKDLYGIAGTRARQQILT